MLAIRARLGIEALIWLTDIAGLSREEAVATMSWSARTLVESATARAGSRRQPSSRCTRSGENAGRQTATYSHSSSVE